MSEPYSYSYDGQTAANPVPDSCDERRLCEIGGCLVYSWIDYDAVWHREHVTETTRLIELAAALAMDDDDLTEALTVLERLS